MNQKQTHLRNRIHEEAQDQRIRLKPEGEQRSSLGFRCVRREKEGRGCYVGV